MKLAENMTLECVYPLVGTFTQMEWFKISATERESIAIFNPTYGMVIRTPYAERVYFLNSSMALNDMTLSFHNASEADVGFYSCILETFPQGSWEKTVQVVPSGKYRFYVPFYPSTTFDSVRPVWKLRNASLCFCDVFQFHS